MKTRKQPIFKGGHYRDTEKNHASSVENVERAQLATLPWERVEPMPERRPTPLQLHSYISKVMENHEFIDGVVARDASVRKERFQ